MHVVPIRADFKAVHFVILVVYEAGGDACAAAEAAPADLENTRPAARAGGSRSRYWLRLWSNVAIKNGRGRGGKGRGGPTPTTGCINGRKN